MPTKTITYDNLETFTRESWDKKLINRVELASAMTKFLFSRRMVGNHAQRMNIPLRYQRADGGSVTKFGPTGLQGRTYYEKETSTVGWVEPVFQSGNIYITEQEEDLNHGEAAIISMLDEKYQYLEDEMTYMFRNATNGFWSDGSAANAWLGIPYWVPDDYGAGTVANVDRTDSTYQYWAGANATNRDAATTLATWNWGKMITLLNNINGDGTKERTPDIGICTKAVYEHIWKQTEPEMRLPITTSLAAKLGLEHINFQGIPITWDVDCPASHLYFLKSADWQFRVLTRANMRVKPWFDSEQDHARLKSVIIGGQVTCLNPAGQGCFTALA